MTRALALRLLRWYPLAWRERYEAEVSALIEDSGLQARDLAELLRGLATERARELMLSTEHVGRTLFILGAMKFALAVGIVASAFVTGSALRTWIGPADDEVQMVVGGVALCFGMVLVVSTLRLQFGTMQRATPRFQVPAWIGAALVAGLFVTIAAMTAVGLLDPYESQSTSGLSRLSPYSIWFLYAMFATDHLSSVWPGRPLLTATWELSNARAEIKLGEQWVAGCHQMMAAGVPSPLDDALAQVAKGVERRDEAQRKLDALGYRARFYPHLHSGNPA